MNPRVTRINRRLPDAMGTAHTRFKSSGYRLNTTSRTIALSASAMPPTAHPMEHAASAWLGYIAADKPKLEARWAGVDRLSRALLASFSSGISLPC